MVAVRSRAPGAPCCSCCGHSSESPSCWAPGAVGSVPPTVPRLLTLTELPLADISPGGSSKNEFWVFHYFLEEQECHCREARGQQGGTSLGRPPASPLRSWM